jgi:hypothetical protein
VPGAHYITEMGIQAPVKKNRPDRFQVLEGEDGSLPQRQHLGGPAGCGGDLPDHRHEDARSRVHLRCLRRHGAWRLRVAICPTSAHSRSPYQEFMKLTTEGPPNSRGSSGRCRWHCGGSCSPTTSRRTAMSLCSTTRAALRPRCCRWAVRPRLPALQGSVKYVVPLQEDVYVQRNEPDILDAFRKSPYTQSLTS